MPSSIWTDGGLGWKLNPQNRFEIHADVHKSSNLPPAVAVHAVPRALTHNTVATARVQLFTYTHLYHHIRFPTLHHFHVPCFDPLIQSID